MATKTAAPVYFEDFRIGDRVPGIPSQQITGGQRAAWSAQVGCRTARFLATDRVHPMQIMSLAQSMMHARFGHGVVGHGGIAQAVWHGPFRVGETLRCSGRVVGLKEDQSDSGLVWLRVAARGDRGVLLSYITWARLPKRGIALTPYRNAPVVPQMTLEVPLKELHTLDLEPLPDPAETGSKYFADDYVPGEKLYHGRSHTVHKGDIAAYARLCLRDAPDNQECLGTQLLSIGYALCLDGMDNRLGIAAINALRWPNRCKQGDVLYAQSRIVEVRAVQQRGVPTRVRLWVHKNRSPKDHPDEAVIQNGQYQPHVVLDVDYWELMPRRG